MSQNKYIEEENEELDEYEDEDQDQDEGTEEDTDTDYESQEDITPETKLNKKEEKEEQGDRSDELDELDPKTIDYSMEQKDAFLKNIEAQINKKKQIMFSKRRFLDKTKQENEYLEGVRADYDKYGKYIIKSKQQEMDAMLLLNNYIDYLILNGNLTNKDLNNAQLEQKHILKEINKIKRTIDDFIATK